MRSFLYIPCLVVILFVCHVSLASASQLVTRGANHANIMADNKGNALVTFKVKGKTDRVLYWGGINQSLAMKIDRSAGWKSKRVDIHKPFPNTCKKVTSASLQKFVPNSHDEDEVIQNVVAACQARDKSFWVLQSSTDHSLQDFGGTTAVSELRVSHFTGQVADLWIGSDWEYAGMWRHLYGQLTYKGSPWYGTHVSSFGASLDGKSRNIAIDSFSSNYPGTTGKWARVNAFLSNSPNGQFCFGLAPKIGDPSLVTAAFRKAFPLWRNAVYSGASSVNRYRGSVPGPGVTPDITIYFATQDPAVYESPDPNSQSGFRANQAGMALDAQANEAQHSLNPQGTGSCAIIN